MDLPRTPRRRTGRWGLPALFVALILAAGAVTGLDGTPRFARWESAAPAVPHGSLMFGTVERGELVRDVRAGGVLVPERERWITTVTAGRIERILVEAGTAVRPDTLIAELSNPDVELQLLEVGRQVAAARSEHSDLASDLESAILAQRAVVAQLVSEQAEAHRQQQAHQRLGADQLVSRMEVSAAEDRARQLTERLQLEQARLQLMMGSREERLSGQREQLESLERIRAFRERQLSSLSIRAESEGVLQDVELRVGQWVQPGERLAIVAEARRLKAELRVAEARAGEVMKGQAVTVDLRTGDELAGVVRRIDPSADEGFVRVEVGLTGSLPRTARSDLNVDGRIELERLADVLHVERPAVVPAESRAELFRLEADGAELRRAAVELGRASARRVEVIDGLAEGDVIVLNDMRRWREHDELRVE